MFRRRSRESRITNLKIYYRKFLNRLEEIDGKLFEDIKIHVEREERSEKEDFKHDIKSTYHRITSQAIEALLDFELINEYRSMYYDIQNYLEFLNQFPPNLQIPMIELLKQVDFYTFNDIINQLSAEIATVASTHEFIYLILFESLMEKSEGAWSYFAKRILPNYNIKTIRARELLDYLKETDQIINDLIQKGDEPYNRYFIILDDVIGSGKQIVDTIKTELFEDYDNIANILTTNDRIYMYLISAIGSSGSRDRIIKELNRLFDISILEPGNIIYGDIKTDNQKAFSLNINNLQNLKKFLRSLDWEYRGFGKCEYLIVLEWNTPNNTISCLWKKERGWIPLFPRAK